MSNETKSTGLGFAIISMIAGELCAISECWNEFDDIDQIDIQRCKKLGAELNCIGGIELMQAVYYEAKSKNKCASVIQSYWDGIGEWRW